jgi:hypothetical protein
MILKEWFKKKPLTKATWIMTIAAIINTWIIIQNSQTISISRRSLWLSIPPAVDVTFPIDNRSMAIQNVSDYDLDDVTARVTCYKVNGHPRTIERRNAPSGPIRTMKRLAPGAKIELPSTDLYRKVYEETREDIVVFALVITFRRSVDHKMFVRVEPYYAFTIEKDIGVISIREPGFGESAPFFVEVYKEIERIEQFMFRSSG